MSGAGNDHVRYEDWDGAYLLGALSPAEAREFEAHLADCGACRDAVAELAAMPGLLRRLPKDEALGLLDEPPTPAAPDLVIPLARAVGRRRRRVRGWTTAGLIAAAAVVAVAFLVPPLLTATSAAHPDTTVALEQLRPSPLQATVALTGEGWGTSIDMDCVYAAATSYGPSEYLLLVTDASGTTTQVMSWTAKPGDTVRLRAATAVPEQQIRAVELREAATGTTLLRAEL